MRRFVRTLAAATTLAIAAPMIPGVIDTALAQQPELSAREIIDRSLDTNTVGFQSGEVQMTIIIQDASGETRERRLQVRGMEEGDLNRALVRVNAPAEVAGQSYLFKENTGGDDDVWVFLPALDSAPRRISGSQKNGSFMGTHFTYADLESRDVRNATHARLPDETIGKFDVYVIDSTPDNPKDSEYARVRMWIRKSDFIPLRVRMFDDKGEAVKTIFTEKTDTQDGRIYVSRLTLRPAEGGATTILIEKADFKAAVSASEFTPQNHAN